MSSPTPGIGPHSGPYESQAIPTSRYEPGDDANRRGKVPSWQAPPRSPPISRNSPGKCSTGPSPASRARTRYNGLKHGLCAANPVIPGERQEEFDAERDAWFGDWQPITHTRAVLVERCAVANWKLKRAVRVEAARLAEAADDVAAEMETRRHDAVDGGMHMLQNLPAEATYRLRGHICGMERLVELWQALGRAVESGWTSRVEHHDRLLNLLGHKAGSEPADIVPPALVGTARVIGVPRPAWSPPWDEAATAAARASFTLLLAHDRAGGPAPKPSEVSAARARLRGFCAERAEEFRASAGGDGDYEVLKQRRMDLGMGATSKEAQLLHRYEMAHEKSLKWALRQLMALEKSGIDLIDEPEPESGPPTASETASEPVSAAPAAPSRPGENDITVESQKTSEELASVGGSAPTGGRPEAPAGSPGRPGGPIGADRGPESPPNRR